MHLNDFYFQEMEYNNTFNCKGKVNVADWELGRTSLFAKEVENIFLPKRDETFSDVEVRLFGCFVPGATAILNLKHFINCMEMILKQFNRRSKYNNANQFSSKNDEDFYSLRKNVCDFVTYVRAYLNSIKWNSESLKEISSEIEEDLEELLSTIRRFFSLLQSMPDSIFHYAASHLGNKCTQPEFHVYHVHLELRWLYVTLIYARNICWQNSVNDQSDELDKTFELVVNDLIYMSMKVFARIPLSELKMKTPFSCTCVRELWLMVQIIIDNQSARRKTKNFWDYVNLILNDILFKNRAEEKVSWFENSPKNLPDCINPELFTIWLIYNLTLVYGYSDNGLYLQSSSLRTKENYDQIEKVLKSYVNKGGKEGDRHEMDEELRIMIPLLRIISTEWWQPRIQILSFLWDCFHRRMDQPFLLQTSGPWSISLEKKSPADILKQIRERLEKDFEQSKESSYGMFLRFLGTFLRLVKNDPKYWTQMKGRIFSKLTKGKIETFSINGLYNFISLFLTLAVTVDTESVCTVLLNLLPSISDWINVDGKKCNLIFKGQLAVLLLFKEQKINFSGVSDSISNAVNILCCQKDDNSISMMHSYVDVLNAIFSTDVKFDLGEHVLIGGWIDRYFSNCSKDSFERLTQILINIFQKCQQLTSTNADHGGVKLMLDALWCHVASRIRQLVLDPSLIGDFYKNLTKLAVYFTIDALKDPAVAQKYKHSGLNLFKHFTSFYVKDTRLSPAYLALILKNSIAVRTLKAEIADFDLLTVQIWIRGAILNYPPEEHSKVLMQYVRNLEMVKEILVLNENSKEPILDFIMMLATKRGSLKTDQEREKFDSRCKDFFKNIDKWILSSLNEKNSATKHGYWIYKCVGLLLICCSAAMYNRNQANNMFRLLISKIALTAENSPHPYVTSLGKQIFSMIFLGIENIHVHSDISMQILIRDLYDQYLPVLITEVHPNVYKVAENLLKCFYQMKFDFCRVIFEKLSDNFIVVPAENTTHKHCFLVMILMRDLLKGLTEYPKYVTDLIISVAAPNVIRCYTKVQSFHPHRLQTVEFVQNILSNHYYVQNPSMSESLFNVILNGVQNSFSASVKSSKSSFEFLNSLADANLKIVNSLLPEIEKIISDYESQKRQNAAALRYSLSQLQQKVKSLSI